MSYDLFTRPSETASRDVTTLQARGYQSVSVISSTARETRPIRRYSRGRLAGPPAKIRAGARASCENRLHDRVRTGTQTSGHATTTDGVENFATAAPVPQHSCCFWICQRSKKRAGLAQTPCDAMIKLANSFSKWHYSIPPRSDSDRFQLQEDLFGSSCGHS